MNLHLPSQKSPLVHTIAFLTLFLFEACVPEAAFLLPLEGQAPPRRHELFITSLLDTTWKVPIFEFVTGDSTLHIILASDVDKAAIVTGMPGWSKHRVFQVTLGGEIAPASYEVPGGSWIESYSGNQWTIIEPDRVVSDQFSSYHSNVALKAVPDSGRILFERPIREILDDKMLLLRDDFVYIMDSDNGDFLWKKAAKNASGPLTLSWQIDGRVFWLGEALWSADPRTDSIWKYETRLFLKPSDEGFLSTLPHPPIIYKSLDGSILNGGVAYALHSQPLLDSGRVFFASVGGVACLNASNGKPLWTVPLAGPPSNSGLVDLPGERLAHIALGRAFANGEWVSTDTPYVTIFDKGTGTAIWHSAFPSSPWITSFERAHNTIYFIANNTLCGLNTATLTLDKKPLKSVRTPQWMRRYEDHLVVGGNRNMEGFAVDSSGSLTPLWKRQTGAVVQTPFVVGPTLWYQTANDSLVGIHLASGALGQVYRLRGATAEIHADRHGVLRQYGFFRSHDRFWVVDASKLLRLVR